MNMSRLRVAVQKSGRLSERSLDLLKNCGLSFTRSKDKLFWYGRDFPVDVLLVRDDDIPRMLLDGVCELGIVGENIALEVMLGRNGGRGLTCLRKLGFGQCRPSLAVPEDKKVSGAEALQGMRIATSYPELTRDLLKSKGISAKIVELSGSVEIAPGLGTADAISDLVSTGTTLRANHLRELEMLFDSQAALYATEVTLPEEKQQLLDRLLSRLEGVLRAAESKYVMLHAPRDALTRITDLLPGVEHPTIMPMRSASKACSGNTWRR
jgi:ATP phosphoribosyltransferase